MGPALLIAVVTILVNAKIGHADWHTGLARFLVSACLSVALGIIALTVLWKNGRLRDRLLPRWGDLTIGVVGALALIIVTWAGRTVLAPRGVPRGAWLAQVYLFLGNTGDLEDRFWGLGFVFLVPMLDEVVWRGWLQDQLSSRLGRAHGWLLTAVLFGLQAIPTVATLSDPVAGPNPLLLALALAAGLIFGFLAHVTNRATSAMIAHAAFSYFILLQFRPAL